MNFNQSGLICFIIVILAMTVSATGDHQPPNEGDAQKNQKCVQVLKDSKLFIDSLREASKRLHKVSQGCRKDFEQVCQDDMTPECFAARINVFSSECQQIANEMKGSMYAISVSNSIADREDGGGRGLPAWGIAGIVLGCLAVIAAISVLSVIIVKRRRSRKHTVTVEQRYETLPSSSQPLQQQLSRVDGVEV